MTVTARTIPNNLFFEEIRRRELQRHTEKVNEIMTMRSQKLKTIEAENDKISNVLRKAKEATKQFEVKERDMTRKKENKVLLEKLWKISEKKNNNIPIMTEQEPTLKHINHRAEHQKRVS